jgi:hypothetical protein
MGKRTFPTAASPSKTSLTLLLGFGADGCAESAMGDDNVSAAGGGEERFNALRLRPTLYEDSFAGVSKCKCAVGWFRYLSVSMISRPALQHMQQRRNGLVVWASLRLGCDEVPLRQDVRGLRLRQPFLGTSRWPVRERFGSSEWQEQVTACRTTASSSEAMSEGYRTLGFFPFRPHLPD